MLFTCLTDFGHGYGWLEHHTSGTVCNGAVIEILFNKLNEPVTITMNVFP